MHFPWLCLGLWWGRWWADEALQVDDRPRSLRHQDSSLLLPRFGQEDLGPPWLWPHHRWLGQSPCALHSWLESSAQFPALLRRQNLSRVRPMDLDHPSAPAHWDGGQSENRPFLHLHLEGRWRPAWAFPGGRSVGFDEEHLGHTWPGCGFRLSDWPYPQWSQWPPNQGNLGAPLLGGNKPT